MKAPSEEPVLDKNIEKRIRNIINGFNIAKVYKYWCDNNPEWFDDGYMDWLQNAVLCIRENIDNELLKSGVISRGDDTYRDFIYKAVKKVIEKFPFDSFPAPKNMPEFSRSGERLFSTSVRWKRFAVATLVAGGLAVAAVSSGIREGCDAACGRISSGSPAEPVDE